MDSHGIVDLGALESRLEDDVLAFAVMAANNETGTLSPLREVSGIAERAGAVFFTDATQQRGRLPFRTACAQTTQPSMGEVGADAGRKDTAYLEQPGLPRDRLKRVDQQSRPVPHPENPAALRVRAEPHQRRHHRTTPAETEGKKLREDVQTALEAIGDREETELALEERELEKPSARLRPPV